MGHRIVESAPATDHVMAADDPAEQVVTAVLAAARLLAEVSARALASVDETLTPARIRLLAVLDTEGGMNLTRLAQALDVLPSTALRTTERLVAHGLLQRKPNPASRREILIGLTDAGYRVVRQVSEARRAYVAGIVSAMPRGECTGLLQALHAFTAAGSRPAHPEQGAADAQA